VEWLGERVKIYNGGNDMGVQKWEYLVQQGQPAHDQLTNLGNEGWELVLVYYHPTGGVFFYFKRPMGVGA
jgi:hypothetical protein